MLSVGLNLIGKYRTIVYFFDRKLKNETWKIRPGFLPLIDNIVVTINITIFYGYLHLLNRDELTELSLNTLFTKTTTMC